jgi:hypothetical protein
VVRALLKITLAHKPCAKRPHVDVSPQILNAIYFPPLGTNPLGFSVGAQRHAPLRYARCSSPFGWLVYQLSYLGAA